MKDTTIVIDIEKNELQQDLHQAIYMLHYLEACFTKEEIRSVCFTLKHLADNLHEKSN